VVRGADAHGAAPPRRLWPARLDLFLAMTLLGLVCITTRFRPTNAARYVPLASPVVTLLFYRALAAVAARRIVRISYLAACAGLVFVSNFRTLDVVSQSIFGTFPFGSHRILDMPSLTGGLKRDTRVHNLEFLQLEFLFGDMIRDLRPVPGKVLLMGNAIYNIPPDVDGRSDALTANPSRAVPYVVSIGDVSPDQL
jgi:hypothetical protein